MQNTFKEMSINKKLCGPQYVLPIYEVSLRCWILSDILSKWLPEFLSTPRSEWCFYASGSHIIVHRYCVITKILISATPSRKEQQSNEMRASKSLREGPINIKRTTVRFHLRVFIPGTLWWYGYILFRLINWQQVKKFVNGILTGKTYSSWYVLYH